ncbi:MAG: A/G-specific adenine glycosylase [Acidimicrobiia bacterium]|nr:A/G-specific adenine glycosylase [Acidimicrobiia bacterium]
MSGRATALLDWYGRHRREAPWRTTSDPWRILVSEVMAQQTQVSRVIPKWRAFLERFPAPADCAAAPRSEVLGLWSGLGYNSRAIRLQEAAAIVTEQGWPTTSEGLRALPGVGPYTAAAVACFAFGEQVPAVDTNLRRVLSRWAGLPLDRGALDDYAIRELPDGFAEDWNQAVMDLASSICSPRDPSCAICPVSDWCTDPSVYEPPRTQGRFVGSRREARGAVIRALTKGPATVDEIAEREGIDPTRITGALEVLAEERLVTHSAAGWRILD